MMNNTNGTFLVYTNPGIDSKFLDRKKNSILRLGGNYRTSFPDINSHKPQLLDLGFLDPSRVLVVNGSSRVGSPGRRGPYVSPLGRWKVVTIVFIGSEW